MMVRCSSQKFITTSTLLLHKQQSDIQMHYYTYSYYYHYKIINTRYQHMSRLVHLHQCRQYGSLQTQRLNIIDNTLYFQFAFINLPNHRINYEQLQTLDIV